MNKWNAWMTRILFLLFLHFVPYLEFEFIIIIIIIIFRYPVTVSPNIFIYPWEYKSNVLCAKETFHGHMPLLEPPTTSGGIGGF